MPSLKAVFKLFDGYSTTINRVIRKTDDATSKILRASGATDTFNSELKATGASAGILSTGLGKLVGTVASLAAVQKGMSIADEYTNTAARLGLITNSLEEQKALQADIFAAADRAKGTYSGMAGAISKMGLMAGEAFSSNGKLNIDELVAFTELLQKGFKVGGSSSTEQSSAMLQLTQAMGSGKLQGDEFRSIMENAPMIADAIAKYTGKSKGELKELSSEGLITPDIIKNAMFMAADDINTKFETMPMTFADIWNRIKNAGTEAFSSIMESITKLLNTDGFTNFVNRIIDGIYMLANIISYVSNLIVDNWPIIQTILIGIGALILINIIGYLTAAIPVLLTNIALWWSMNAPIVAIVATIALVIYALGQMGVTVEDVFGFIGAVIGVSIATIHNLFLGAFELVLGILNFLVNPIIQIANLIGNVFINPISSVIYLFQGMADSVLGIIEKIASAMDLVFGSNMADTVSGWRSGLKEMADAAVAKRAPDENYQKLFDEQAFSVEGLGFERMNYTDSWNKGKSVGTDVYGNIEGALNSLTGSFTGKGSDFDVSEFGTTSNPLSIVGTGSGGKVDVDMSDEDLKYMRDIAERDYINKFSTATLAPNVAFTFGDIRETADVNQIKGTLEKMMCEEIAVAAEGDYNV